jgi:hypothetical protein
MSTALQVYAVPFARLQALRGGREESLLAVILRDWSADLEQIDQQTQENVAEELEGYPEFLACGTALHQIFTGASLNPELGKVYIQAYHLVVEALAGGAVGEWSPIAGSGAFFQRLDGWLKECGAGVTLVNLTCRGPVIDVPEAIDFPSVGYWTPEEVGQGARSLQRAATNWRPWTRRVPPADLTDSIADIRQWLEAARRNAGHALVGVQTY